MLSFMIGCSNYSNQISKLKTCVHFWSPAASPIRLIISWFNHPTKTSVKRTAHTHFSQTQPTV